MPHLANIQQLHSQVATQTKVYMYVKWCKTVDRFNEKCKPIHIYLLVKTPSIFRHKLLERFFINLNFTLVRK